MASLVESLAETSAPEHSEIVAARGMEQSSNGDAICSVSPAEASGKLPQGCPSPLSQGARSHWLEAGLRAALDFPAHVVFIYALVCGGRTTREGDEGGYQDRGEKEGPSRQPCG